MGEKTSEDNVKRIWKVSACPKKKKRLGKMENTQTDHVGAPKTYP